MDSLRENLYAGSTIFSFLKKAGNYHYFYLMMPSLNMSYFLE